MRAHPEHSERHIQTDQRQHNREPGIVDAHVTFEVVEGDNNSCEGKRQPEYEEEQEDARARDSQVADGKTGHGRDG
jgi:hypothetical protein